jgi:divalent metal cation (Fe/Co/Zn/Cd) transporter
LSTSHQECEFVYREAMGSEVQALSRNHASDERARDIRRAKALSWLSVLWMAIEATVGVIAAIVAGSVSLLGFGLDSLIEVLSASAIIWLFTTQRRSEHAERRAQKVIAACFAALALYLLLAAITTLMSRSEPDVSWAGIAISAAAIIVMPLLAKAKKDVATRLGSSATASDAAQSRLCALIAAGALTSLVANTAFGLWWLDPIVGLVIAGVAIREGREAWAGEVCDDCAPIGFDATIELP